MSLWLSLAIGAQFLYAITTLIDKHIIVRTAHIGKPIVYTFFVSVLSGFVVVIVPFGLVTLPSAFVLDLSLLSGATFVAGLFFLYSALKIARASDVAPVVGALSAMTTLALAAISIKGDIDLYVFPAVVLLAGGTALISRFHFSRATLFFVLASGAMFGASIFLDKLVYLRIGFFSGFFWTRALTFAVALGLLLIPALRRAIFHGGRHSTKGAKALVFGNKALSSVASVTSAYAVSLGSVSIVNALSGLQFVFLFLFALLFAKRMPELRDSNITRAHGGVHTAFGIALIVAGLALLYLSDGLV